MNVCRFLCLQMEFLLEYADEEIWRPIEGFPSYSISHLGNLKNTETGKLKQPYYDKKSGYLIVNLWNGSKSTARRIHILVADAFLPKDPTKGIVDHIDRNKLNNSVLNLRRVTPKENSMNTEVYDTSLKRWKNVQEYIHENPGATYTEIASKLGLHRTTISKYKRKWTMIEK